MCILGVIFWNLLSIDLKKYSWDCYNVTASGIELQGYNYFIIYLYYINIPLILTLSVRLRVYRHECVCVCSQQASRPWARSKVRWGGRELWEMKPSWTWITFAHNGANRSSDTWACLRDSQWTNWKKKRFYYFPSLICDYPLTFLLSHFLLGIVSLSHSLLNDINWQEAEFSGWSQPFLQRNSYCFKYPWMDSASVCTKNMDRCTGRLTHTRPAFIVP